MEQILFFIFVSLNTFVLIAFGYGAYKIAPSLTRTLFLIFMFFNIAWFNLLYLVQVIPLSYAGTISTLIYLIGVLNIGSGGLFVISFSGKLESEIRSTRFWFFGLGLLGNFALMPWISTGVIENEIGMRQPVRGPGIFYFACSWLCWFLYTAAILVKAYRKEQDRLYRFQLQYLFKISALSFAIIFSGISFVGFLNLQIPGAYIGMLGSLFLFSGMIRILSDGPIIYLKKSLQKLFTNDCFARPDSIYTLESLFYFLSRGLTGNRMLQPLAFTGPGGQTIQFTLSKGIPVGPGRSLRNVLSLDHFRGMQDTIETIQRENINLCNQLTSMQTILDETQNAWHDLSNLNHPAVNSILQKHAPASREEAHLISRPALARQANLQIMYQLASQAKANNKFEIFHQWELHISQNLKQLAAEVGVLTDSEIKAQLLELARSIKLPFIPSYVGEHKERLEYLSKNLKTLRREELLEYWDLLVKIAPEATGMSRKQVSEMVREILDG